MTDNKNGEWQKLDWSKKVELCEQGRGNENTLLQTYRIIFVALETILFAAVYTDVLILAMEWACFAFGLFFAILWVHVSELAGNRVDRWEEILAELWSQADGPQQGISELPQRFRGAVERRKRRRESGRLAIFLEWGVPRFLSARWVFSTFIPILVVCLWILAAVTSFDC